MTLDIQTMKHVSDHVGLRRAAKVGARGTVGFGLLAIVAGLAGLKTNLLAIPLLALGLFLVGSGAWVLKKASAPALRLAAVALWAVAVWNIATGLLSVAFSGGEGVLWIAVGAWQVYWAVQARRRAARFDAFMAMPGSAASLAELDGMVSEIQAQSLDQTPDLIAFDAASLTTRQHWKARLGQGWALFVDAGGAEVLVASSGDVAVARQGETAVRHRIKADITLLTRHLKGTIAQQSLDRLVSWKAVQAA